MQNSNIQDDFQQFNVDDFMMDYQSRASPEWLLPQPSDHTIGDYLFSPEEDLDCPPELSFKFSNYQPQPWQPPQDSNPRPNPPNLLSHPPSQSLPNTHQQISRNTNTIKGPVMTGLKAAIEESDRPWVSALYPQIRSLKRTFVDFEKIFSIFEFGLGSTDKARQELLNLREKVLDYGRYKFELKKNRQNPERLQCFELYADKVFRAFEQGANPQHRLRIMYEEDRRYKQVLKEIEEFRSQLSK